MIEARVIAKNAIPRIVSVNRIVGSEWKTAVDGKPARYAAKKTLTNIMPMP